ncbi:TerD family protein [Pseudonocardia kunmingensis]|uniref:Stress response protein SCP2 n=1 Tax=Pseudonocardia kunmingensis TaxID=630975 RepID=A0A543DHW1_9PSEU|nr:TerD family protein [Pseudonocardia kunmingensis]TQM08944.1 stress response protein SCP2 [Pseudonocardia kunmingensis]
MPELPKGSKTTLGATRYVVDVGTAPSSAGAVDVTAVLLGADGKVRSDEDLVFYNNPSHDGVELDAGGAITVDLAKVPGDVDRVLVAGSTEAQGARFSDVRDLVVTVRGDDGRALRFEPPGLAAETVLQMVAFYRRAGGWKLDAIGQGYDQGLAAFAVDHGIDVADEPAPPPAPAPARAPAVNMQKVSVVLTKDSPDKTARIDLRKSRGEPGWVLTVGLEWDGRGAKYDRDGKVTKYGRGDLDVYFLCRNEETGDYVVISGERGHQGDLDVWPFIRHGGDSQGPGRGNAPAAEQVHVRPTENGDLLVNVYQSVDNGGGAIDTFGRPRVVIRYGRAGADGLPGPDADEIVAHVGNSKNSFWATVAHIDVRDGVLTVDGETRYSRAFDERMPLLTTSGTWVRAAKGGPRGQSKKRKGQGLDRYSGRCPDR